MRIQAGLDVPDGGFGLNFAEDDMEAAFVASLAMSFPGIQQIAARTRHPTPFTIADAQGQPNDSPLVRLIIEHRKPNHREARSPDRRGNLAASHRSRK